MCRKAFSLIELLVVVAIGAILAAILFPVLALMGRIVDDTAFLPKRPDAASPEVADEIVLVHQVSGGGPPVEWRLVFPVRPNPHAGGRAGYRFPLTPSAPTGKWAPEYTP